MTHKSNHRIIAQCLTLISATYGAKFPTNDYTAGVWIVLLDDIPPDELQAAVIDWCRTMDWPPTPAELRKRCPSQCKCGQCISCKRKMFRARLSKYRSDYITLDGGEVVRSIWRSWKAHNWIYQVDGELWAITHPADRLKWE